MLARATLLAATFLIALVPLAAPAHADACNLDCILIPVQTPAATFYVWYGPYNDVWLFQETNGVAGWQPGGCSQVVADDCWSYDWSYQNPDQLIF